MNTQKLSYYDSLLLLQSLFTQNIPDYDVIGDRLSSLDDVVIEANEVVGLLGRRGAGKTTLLNALLGSDILSTYGRGTCTAVPLKVSYLNCEKTIHITVHFIKEEDWVRELEFLKADMEDDCLTPVEERMYLLEPVENLVTKAAKEKVLAVYGSIESCDFSTVPHELEEGYLHKTFSREAEDDIKEFLNRYSYCSDSPKWPLVQSITVRGCFDILKNGLTLVDLPGLYDGSSVLPEVVRSFREQCTRLLFVEDLNNMETQATYEWIVKEILPSPHPCSIVITKTDGITDHSKSVNTKKKPRLSDVAEEQRRVEAHQYLLNELEKSVTKLKNVITQRVLSYSKDETTDIAEHMSAKLEKLEVFMVSSKVFLEGPKFFPQFMDGEDYETTTHIPKLIEYLEKCQSIKREELVSRTNEGIRSTIQTIVEDLKQGITIESDSSYLNGMFMVDIDTLNKKFKDLGVKIIRYMEQMIEKGEQSEIMLAENNYHVLRAICKRGGSYYNSYRVYDFNRLFISKMWERTKIELSYLLEELANDLHLYFFLMKDRTPVKIHLELLKAESSMIREVQTMHNLMESKVVKMIAKQLKHVYSSMLDEGGKGAVKAMKDIFSSSYTKHHMEYEKACMDALSDFWNEWSEKQLEALVNRFDKMVHITEMQYVKSMTLVNNQLLPVLEQWNNKSPEVLYTQLCKIQFQPKHQLPKLKNEVDLDKIWAKKLEDFREKTYGLIEVKVPRPSATNCRGGVEQGWIYIQSTDSFHSNLYRIGSDSKEPEQSIFEMVVQNYRVCEETLHRILEPTRLRPSRGLFEVPVQVLNYILLLVVKDLDPDRLMKFNHEN